MHQLPEAILEPVRARCERDPWFYATNFVKTCDPQADDPIRPFPPYDYLKAIFSKLMQYHLLAFPKSRQLLLTWVLCIYALWKVGFQHNRQVMIQSQKQEKARALIDRSAFILRHQPENLFPCDLDITRDVKRDVIEFRHAEGKSSFWAVAQGPDQVASYSPSVFLSDETALQEDAEQAHKAALPALRQGGQLVYVSSVRNPDEPGGQFFYDICHNNPAVHVHPIHYTAHPDFSPEWAAEIKKRDGYDDLSWAREMEMDWSVGLGVPVFRPPFDKNIHIQDVHPFGMEITRGWDYGIRHPACVWIQENPRTKQVMILNSATGNNDGFDNFVETQKREFPGHRFMDFDDPSGINRQVRGLSYRAIMQQHQVYPGNSATKVPMDSSIELIKSTLMPVRGTDGILRPGMLFSPRCERLIDAFNGSYTTQADKEKRFHGGITEHEVDALRYALAGTRPWLMRN